VKLIHIAASALIAQSFSAVAQTPAVPSQAASVTTAAPMTEGEVRKIDKEQGKVTLRHGPIDNLGMPGMTMIFKVADPKMLDTVKEGDKVQFTADKVNGAITVTRMEAVK
jgi:Cu(I)/Ag(I) efflux system protein CusF